LAGISANSLFHFTKYENLVGILTHEFYPRYSVEEHPDSAGNSHKMAFPMVCFCDIPLAHISEHMSTYGEYGLGMTKQWAIANRLNPVLYVEKTSWVSEKLEHILAGNWESVNALPIKQFLEERDSAVALYMHTKPYDGYQERNGVRIRKCFYDEREWRYVPRISRLDGHELHLTGDNLAPSILEAKNDMLKAQKIGFEPKDIQYIIIGKEAERLQVIESIEAIKSPKYDWSQVKLLASKIVSAEQIEGDI
jgi:hypothetical protein